MTSTPAPPPEPLPVRTYLEDGAHLAAILLVWGVIAGFTAYAIGTVGGPGSPLQVIGSWLGSAIGVAGVLNAVLYVAYRAIDYWRA